MKSIFAYILLLLTFISCGYFSAEAKKDAIARVNNEYLYSSDLEGLVSKNTSKEDSLLIVNSFITRWATQQLLINKALVNLSPDKQANFEELVQEYKKDLYTEAYKNQIVLNQIDSTVTGSELKEFYDANRDNFKLNDQLVKVRYIQLDKTNDDVAKTREQLSRFNSKDKKQLQQVAFQYKTYNFNDSIWVQKDVLLEALPVIQGKESQVLNKSNFTQLQDSLGIYLVKIENVLNPNDVAPLSYVRGTITQIILNKRKLELIKKLETDITKDAIKNNDFEIYNNQ